MPSNSKIDSAASPPLVVSPKRACQMLDCSMTRFYELLKTGQIQSYRDGKSRKAVVASLSSYIERQLQVEASKPSRGWTDRATQVRMANRKTLGEAMKPSSTGVPSRQTSTRKNGPGRVGG